MTAYCLFQPSSSRRHSHKNWIRTCLHRCAGLSSGHFLWYLFRSLPFTICAYYTIKLCICQQVSNLLLKNFEFYVDTITDGLYHIFIILCNIIIDMIFNLPEGWKVFGIQKRPGTKRGTFQILRCLKKAVQGRSIYDKLRGKAHARTFPSSLHCVRPASSGDPLRIKGSAASVAPLATASSFQ